ncbi:hypothetical protein MUG78_17980 [Gordonia alkaliphila]|nr:hypothetical protein [Gordonia alkaliphila]MCK0441292.1 hypothetical protein [Gordonia alkaliphila]
MSVPAPFTSTATRDGARIVVTRHDDVAAGEPLITILTDGLGLLSLAPGPAEVLGRLLLRTVADTATVSVAIANSYPELGQRFARTERVTLPAPADGEDLDEWTQMHLLPLTGEGPEYSSAHGVYGVRINSAPVPFEHLIGPLWSLRTRVSIGQRSVWVSAMRAGRIVLVRRVPSRCRSFWSVGGLVVPSLACRRV